MLTVQGPTLSFSQPYYEAAGSQQINIDMSLEGQNSLPVSVSISAALRSILDAGAGNQENGSTGLKFSLNQSTLVWGPGETGTKAIRLDLDGDLSALNKGGIVVSIESAENADISERNSSAVVSALAREELVVGFNVEPNQVSSQPCNLYELLA